MFPIITTCRRMLATALMCAVPLSVMASSDLWVDVAEPKAVPATARQIVPVSYRTMQLDLEALKYELANAPLEFSKTTGKTVVLPMPNGDLVSFEAKDSPIMEAALAARHPDFRTFSATGIDRPELSARFGWTSKGFHAIVFMPGQTVYIDPYSRNDKSNYIVYRKQDFVDNEAAFECGVEGHANPDKMVEKNSRSTPLNGDTLRTYRLAMAANYEYTQFHSGPLPNLANKADALAAIVTTMNRVNAVYERDIAVRMILVADEELIIFDTPADPYVNEDGISMLATNPGVLDGLIGSANYDIGHVFSTGGGGVAGLGVVCQTGLGVLGHKANGVTGRGQPVGDPFDIDYVAHEIGHQFGGNHTFNGSTGSCSGGNRNGATAYEVGSGTTIMAYAGICGAQNTQSNSDDLFHLASLIEMTNYINGGGNSCAAKTPTGNTIPIVDAGPDFTIPPSTPFKLTATGSDADGDSLTYAWEQYDLGAAGGSTTDTGSGPLFRAFNTTANPVRTLPQNADLPGGPFPYGELLPTTSRTMKFRVTARDKMLDVPGAIAWDEMTVTVDSGAQFDVVYPNGGETWLSGATETVTWLFTNTNVSPINTLLVDILLSTDGGETYTTLLSGVPNDGSQDVIVPAIASTTAVIKVRAADNIYFEISDAVFTIIADQDNDTIEDSLDNCPLTANTDQLDFDADGFGDACDNCTIVANPTQCDTNFDGYGNHCDADIDNNGIVNSFDLGIMRNNFGAAQETASDLNCDNIVNSFDLTIMRNSFGGAPGPSALAP